MKIIDNLPINVSCIGTLIEEECAIGRFYDNRLYLLSQKNSELAESAMKAMTDFNEKMSEEDYFNHYDLEVIDIPNLKNHSKINQLLNESGSNVLMQLNTPGVFNKQFIVAKTDTDNLYKNIGLMIYEAERITKANLAKVLKAYAFDNLEDFAETARISVSNKEFLSNYLFNLMDSVMHPSFGMAASKTSVKKKLEIEGVITHKRKLEIVAHLLENMELLRKKYDPKIDAEVDLIFNSIDPRTWKRFFAKQSPKFQEKMFAYINPVAQAEASMMDLEVRHIGKIDKIQNTNGKYRLFMKRDYESLMVHFQRKNSFIIYLIYLLDRKKNGNNVDSLNISKYKALFSSLYEMVYGVKGDEEFVNMMKHFNDNDEVKQRGFNLVFHKMKEDIGDTCERMREPPEPFLLYDCNSHLTVLPEHIILPKEMIALTYS